MEGNYGHDVWFSKMYWQFPKYFAISDPDLEFNKNMPKNVLNILKILSNEHKKGKVGFALDISDSYLFYQNNSYSDSIKIETWEKQFWIESIEHSIYELYNAKIDTTFCLVNKEFMAQDKKLDGLRIAGDFTCKHTPWYDGWHKLLDPSEWIFFKENNISSSTLKLIFKMQQDEYNKSAMLFRDINQLTLNMGELVNKLAEYNDNNDNNNDIKPMLNDCINTLTKYKVKLGNDMATSLKNKI
jgi:hypothetical protein